MLINDQWMDEIASIVADLNADEQRRAGVLEIDDHLKSLRNRLYPKATKIPGEEAYAYLQTCALEIYSVLKLHGGSYSKHKWLWYLRRIPDTVFQFKTLSSPEYDRAVAESAAGMYGTSSSRIQHSYPVQKTTVRQVLRFCGMCLHLSDVFGAMQWAGTGLDFEFRSRPIPDAIASDEDNEAVHLYTRRLDAEYPMFSRLGIITGLRPPKSSPLLTAPLFRSCPPEDIVLRSVHFPFDGSVAARYRPRFVALDDVLAFLSNTTLNDQPFARGVGALVLLHRTMLLLGFAEVAYPAQMLLLGFCHVPLKDFVMVADRVCGDLAATLQRLPGSIAKPGNAGELLSELAAITPVMQPLATGPIVLVAGETVCVDLAAATQRLYSDLEAPVTTGPVANYRSHYFEIGLQEVIDRTLRVPSPEHRALRGRTLRLAGASITDVDALAETEHHILLISCKSVPYTARYDMGEYKSIRNVRTMIEKEVPIHQAKVAKLNQNLKGDNYTFTKPIIGVICTPHTVVLPLGAATAEVIPGLRAAVSASELGRWCLGSDDAKSNL